MHTDSPFYQLFLLLRESIFYLISWDPALAEFYDFTSVEIKELKRRIDGVYFPQRVEDPFIFVEVQFQPDPTLYQRLVMEGLTYLSQQDPANEDWLMVAIWPSQSLDPGIPGYYKTFQHQIMRVYLDQLPLDVQPLGLVLMRMMATERDPEIRELAERALELARESRNVDSLKLVQMLLSYRYPNLGAEELAKMFTFSQEDMKKLKLYQEGTQEGSRETAERVIRKLAQQGSSLTAIAEIVEWDPLEVQKVLDQTSNH
ncbi:MAG: DUF2887 domain-containing protein [Synechococcaceae cyanobacterium RM1_1_27]|nr:DUF2887 domain-containing protein [Synechococcaceae cyanobacterium RM1_1_27]